MRPAIACARDRHAVIRDLLTPGRLLPALPGCEVAAKKCRVVLDPNSVKPPPAALNDRTVNQLLPSILTSFGAASCELGYDRKAMGHAAERFPAWSAILAGLIQRHHAGATQSQIVLQAKLCGRHLTLSRAASKLVREFIALRQPGRAQRMAF